MNSHNSKPDEFYVGYLPGPPGHIRFLKRAVPAMLLMIVVIGAVTIRAHNNPGKGSWDTDTEQKLEGIIDTSPYAMIRVSIPGKGLQSILLVSEGKFGARERAEPFRGQYVRVTGTLLERDGRRLLELTDGDKAIERTSDASAAMVKRMAGPPAELLTRQTFRGQTIDPKCYLGAMKPGEGKAHKDCATLCISGGIPPMFITRNVQGVATYYLLSAPDGGPASDGILPFIADAVEISGDVERLADLLVFKIDPKDIRRL